MTTKYLVTGAAGFIGSNLISYLMENTDGIVSGLDGMKYAANPKTLMELEKVGAKVHLVDLLDQEKLEELIRETDIVIHLAAESHNDNSIINPRPFVESNVIGTFNVLEACRRFDKRLHHVSTDEVFGDLELDDPSRFTELSPYNPSSPYSSTKAASDLLVRAWVRTFGIEATISNCSNNFGPFQHVEKFIPRQITNVLDDVKPKIYGTGNNVRDWIHVDTHSSGVLKVLEKGISGETYLIGNNGERSNLEVLALILEQMGKPEDWFDFVEDRPGHDMRYSVDSSKLRNELGWNPPQLDLPSELERTIRWYDSNRTWWREAKQFAESVHVQFEGR